MIETKKDVKEIKAVPEKKEEPVKKEAPKEDEYTKKLKVIGLYDQYVTNMVNARYFAARCNMIVKQLNGEEELIERVDDKPKSKEFLEAEFFLTKFRAYRAYRDAYFNLTDLKKLGITEAEVDKMFKDRLEGPIRRETYEESFKQAGKATFVPQDKKE